ncbi:MAG: prepilin-type N-terminal cleavage/methylation domain-containing protein, partial [Planctomycetes bacterium]|nr:prepilin-type N-terminal cleavage/methylation domain-containing protein [Planctomycetota bacterium]
NRTAGATETGGRDMSSRHHGFTLAELVMALVITSIIALAAVAVASVLSTAHAHSEAHYGSIETARSAMRRVQRALQSAQLITAVNVDHGGESVTCWTGDENSDGRINVLEVRFLEYDSGAGEIREYRVDFPDGWPQAAVDIGNTAISLEDLTTMTPDSLPEQASLYLTSLLLACDVGDFSVSAWPGPPMSKLVRVEFTVGAGQGAMTLRSAAALRAEQTCLVGEADDDYVLMTP